MSVDVEVSLNRFGFYRPTQNKIQIGPLRISWWNFNHKHSLTFEANWITSSHVK